MSLKTAFPHIMRWEQGYVDDPDDPGGATNWGIALNRIGRRVGLRTKMQIKNLTMEQARAIYLVHYWMPCKCDDLPDAIALAVFDCAVNQGVRRASRLLQRAATAYPDGRIGPRTIAAVSHHDEALLLTNFMARRALHYSSLAKIGKYGYGWFRRMFDIHRAASKLLP